MLERSNDWMNDPKPVVDWAEEFYLRKQIPSLTHEEYETMDIEKFVFWVGISNAIAEKEQNSIDDATKGGKKKIKNRGSAE